MSDTPWMDPNGNIYSHNDTDRVGIRKIEELTLYIIEQEKRIAELEKKLDTIKQ